MNHMVKRSKKFVRGLSRAWDEYFVHNLVIGVSVIMIRAGVRGLIDLYVTDRGVGGRIACIVFGVILLYLVDGSIGQLGGKNKDKSDH